MDAHPEEIHLLFEDLLIHVTRFFREPPTYAILGERVFPELLKAKKAGEPLRIWIPGCSTGEEAYSTAITLLETMERVRTRPAVQIFASDVSEKALAKARAGVYPASISRDVSAARLRKFFSRGAGGFTVDKRLREMCIFAHHDLTRQPPFSKLDLVSCRNLLIYMEPELQKHVLRMFQYALRPGGALVLSESESIAGLGQLFELSDRKHKVYTRTEGPAAAPGIAEAARQVARKSPFASPAPVRRNIEDTARELLLREYVPACFVTDECLDILQFWGPVSEFLAPESGASQMNLLKMLHPDLRGDARLAVHRAARGGQTVKRGGIPLGREAKARRVDVEAAPLPGPADGLYFLVTLREAARPAAARAATRGAKEGGDGRDQEISALREDLSAAIDYSQTYIRQFESINEELTAANEEVVSTNEELQSTNEELETAKEELQTANDELVSRNRELQRALESKALMAAIVESSDDAIVAKKLDGTITSWNAGAERIFGYTAAEAVGQHIFLIVPEHLREQELQILARLKQGERIEHFETLRRAKDGRLIDVSMTVSPVRDLHGRVIGASKVARDVTERKRLEMEIRDANRLLEERVRQRTADLEAFSYTIAHDLRSPLRAIHRYSDFVRRDYAGKPLDAAAAGYLLRISGAADRMNELIEDLLAFGQVSRVEVRRQPVDLQTAVDQVRSDLAHELPERGAEILIARDLPVVMGDSVLVGQIFANLLGNAIKFVPSGTPPQVRVYAERAGAVARVTVQDNGIGFDPKYAERIFQTFERLVTQEEYPGTGIGLAIVRKAIERLDGKTGAHSEPGKGSRFWVELPLAAGK
jgi:two-component system CheB/CheR fusion protein